MRKVVLKAPPAAHSAASGQSPPVGGPPSSVPLAATDIVLHSDEPRIPDLRLAARLGFASPYDIRKLISRNRDELETYGALCARRENSRHRGANSPRGGANSDSGNIRHGGEYSEPRRRGAPGTAYDLNEGQCLVLGALARTPGAAALRREVISVFLAYRHGRLSLPPLPSEDSAALHGLADMVVALQEQVQALTETMATAFVKVRTMPHLALRHWQHRGRQKSAWIVRFTDWEGKRHIQTFGDKAAAEEFRVGLIQAREVRAALPEGRGELLLGVAAIAEHLGTSTDQAGELARAGTIPTFDAGGMLSARRSSLDRWMREAEIEGRLDSLPDAPPRGSGTLRPIAEAAERLRRNGAREHLADTLRAREVRP